MGVNKERGHLLGGVRVYGSGEGS
jgi:hypothetical protein